MNKEEILNTFLLANIPEIITQEEFDDVKKAIKQLQQENKILKENAENNDKVVDKVNWENQLLKKENQQIKDNWNKLKECLKDVMNSSEADDKEFVETILDIMQELEQGRDNQ